MKGIAVFDDLSIDQPGEYALKVTAGSPSPVVSASFEVHPLTFVSMSAGHLHTCGVIPAEAAFRWGSNSWGQLGDGTSARRLTPARVVQ